jgi:multiple sugar transport system ATP-binding protein
LGIQQLLDRKPKQLSGGQRQRVALGRAIVREPAVFLLDEPLSNLDAKLRIQTRAEISRLHQRLGTTFVYVTHDQIEAMTMANRIAVMRDGVLQQVDSPQNLYDHPTNVFVAGFIGSPPMNLFESTVTGDSQELFIDTGQMRFRLEGEMASKLSSNVGRQVILGIRPEDIHHPEFLPANVSGSSIEATVELTEMMGSETFAYMVVGDDQRFVGKLDPRAQLRTGDKLNLLFDISALHIFDTQTEMAIVT